MLKLENIRRPENLMPGDRVKVWGEDLEVARARPVAANAAASMPPGVLVEFVDGSELTYQPGVLIEIADTTVDTETVDG